jgi:hypothetical protein
MGTDTELRRTPITGFCLSVLWRRYLQCLDFFPGGVSRGQGTKSKQIFPSPAAQRFLINGRMHRVFARQGTLVPATPGWEIWRTHVTGARDIA